MPPAAMLVAYRRVRIESAVDESWATGQTSWLRRCVVGLFACVEVLFVVVWRLLENPFGVC